MPHSKEDVLFGTVAVQLGYATKEQVEECSRIQEKIEGVGLTPKPLGEIMVEMGYLTADQVIQIVKSQTGQSVRPKPASLPSKVTAKTSEPSLQITGYNIIEKIGLGKTGTVYKALQLSLQRIVALKVLLPHLTQDKKFVERFFNEARAVARLSHSNIVQGIDVGECGGLFYFVMEYIDGPTLERMVKGKGPLEEILACDFILQISRALEHAHRNEMVHRDIKPHNIMVNSFGVAKLCDLGIVKLRARSSTISGGRAKLVGTPAYISPEQARGERGVDIRADIYSLGITFYYLVTGSVPFPGETIEEVIRKHLNEQPLPPIQRNNRLSKRVNTLILKMMEKAREKRYQSPTELISVLEALKPSVQTGKRPISAQSVGTIPSKIAGSRMQLERRKRLARLRLRQEGEFKRS